MILSYVAQIRYADPVPHFVLRERLVQQFRIDYGNCPEELFAGGIVSWILPPFGHGYYLSKWLYGQGWRAAAAITPATWWLSVEDNEMQWQVNSPLIPQLVFERYRPGQEK